ncbi:MAG: signal peptidase I [Candidatus Limnocylindria bacterium]
MRRLTVVGAGRALLSLAFALLAITVLGIGAAARLAPGMDHELYAIRSGSMEPALPVGALVVVDRTRADQAAAGDVVAYRLPNGAVVTHRVVETVRGEAGAFLETRGDANQVSDPSLVPVESVVGVVTVTLPWLGLVLALLGMPIGVVTILSVAGTLLTAIWLLEELEADEEEDENQDEGRAPAGADHPAAGAEVRW